MTGWEQTIDADEGRLAGLLALLVDSRGPVPASRITARVPGYRDDLDSAAEHLGQDADRLEALGLTIETETFNGETTLALAASSWEPRPLALDDDDRLLLEKALEIDVPLSPDLAAAVAAIDGGPKITSSTTISLSGLTAPVRDRADVYSRLHRLARQMSHGIVAGFGYPDASGTVADRSLEVYGFADDRGVWFAIGLEPGSEVIRAFAVSEMTGPVADVTGEDAYEVPADFEVAPYVALGWRLGPDPEPTHVVFDAALAPFIAATLSDVPLYRSDDGSLEAKLSVGDIERFVCWVLTFGTHARILMPHSAAHRAVEVLGEMAKRNG